MSKENETENQENGTNVVLKVINLGETSKIEINGNMSDISNAIVGTLSDVGALMAKDIGVANSMLFLQELVFEAQKQVSESLSEMSEDDQEVSNEN